MPRGPRAPHDLYSPERPTAVVLSGTGADGAYHAGVLKALHDAGVKVDLVAGRGVGVLGAVLSAVDGAATLWEPLGFWHRQALARTYRPTWRYRAIGLALLLSAAAISPSRWRSSPGRRWCGRWPSASACSVSTGARPWRVATPTPLPGPTRRIACQPGPAPGPAPGRRCDPGTGRWHLLDGLRLGAPAQRRTALAAARRAHRLACVRHAGDRRALGSPARRRPSWHVRDPWT